MGATAVKMTGNSTINIFLLDQCSNGRIRHATHAVMTGNKTRLSSEGRDHKISYRMVGDKIAAHVTMNISCQATNKKTRRDGAVVRASTL